MKIIKIYEYVLIGLQEQEDARQHQRAAEVGGKTRT